MPAALLLFTSRPGLGAGEIEGDVCVVDWIELVPSSLVVGFEPVLLLSVDVWWLLTRSLFIETIYLPVHI